MTDQHTHSDLNFILFQLVLSARRATRNVNVREGASNRDSVIRNLFRHLVDLLQAGSGCSERAGNLLHEYSACDTTAADFATLLPSNTAVVCHNNHLCLNARSFGLFNRHAEVEHIASIVHDNNQHALTLLNPLQDASSDLLRTGRGEDRSRYGAREQAWSDEGCERGFVACATARYQGDLRFRGIGSQVDDFVLGV